jgi:hypothetical protein
VNVAADAIGMSKKDSSWTATTTTTTTHDRDDDNDDDNNNNGVWLDRSSHIRVKADQSEALEENMNPNYVALRDTKDCLFAWGSKLYLIKHVAPDLPQTFLGLDVTEGRRPLFFGGCSVPRHWQSYGAASRCLF